jgi:MFS family permease
MTGTRHRWSSASTALLLLAAINLMNYYDRLLIVVVSQPLRLEFQLTDTQYGLLTGPAFVFVYAISSIVFGMLADRVERRRLIASATALWSILTACCGLAQSFPMLALARAGVGVGEGGANPAGLSLLSDHFPPERRALAMAMFQTGGMVGMLASFVVASQIAITYGWRMVFLVAAAPGLVIAALTWLLMREPTRGQYDPAPHLAATQTGSLRALRCNSAYVWLSLAACFGVFSSLGMLIWLPQFFIRSHGMTQSQVGLLFGPVAALGLIAGTLLGGWLGDRMARRSLASPVIICICANLALIPICLLVLWSGSTPLALIACFVAMALAVVYAPAFQATMQTVCAPKQRGTASAVSNVLNALIGQGVLVLIVGQVSDALALVAGQDSLRWALTASLTFTAAAGLIFLGAYPRVRNRLGQVQREASASSSIA